MNREDRRKLERQRSQTAKKQATAKPVAKQPTEQEIYADLRNLLANAQEKIEEELGLTLGPERPPEIKDMILLVMDGTSPFAVLAPPELAKSGKKRHGVRLGRRVDFAEIDVVQNPQLDAALSKPSKCGHLEYLVSTSTGSVITCVTCSQMQAAQNDGASR